MKNLVNLSRLCFCLSLTCAGICFHFSLKEHGRTVTANPCTNVFLPYQHSLYYNEREKHVPFGDLPPQYEVNEVLTQTVKMH
uniref:Secreted protein n=1 Tax=Anser brachyrhynchus TaxID=132585 RepID=A0A8B9BZS7_9AVES